MLHRNRLLGLLCSPLLLMAGLAAFAATAPAAQAAPCQVNVVTTNACGGGGGGGGGSGVDPLPGTPHYAIHAVYVHCIDTTGSTQIGSDETQFTFTAIDGQAVRSVNLQRLGNIDSGDTEYFGFVFGAPRELSRIGGSVAPLNLAIDVVELDSWPDSNDTIGHRDLTWSPAELAQAVPNVGMSFVQPLTFTGDSSNYVLYLTVTRVS
jgi:hypothetical protein